MPITDSASISESSGLPAGARMEAYEIIGELGRGGFSITYQAQDMKLNRQAIIKEYLPLDCAVRRGDYTVGPRSAGMAENFKLGLESFLQEARTLAQFHHPNIVPILDFFEARQGTGYLVMPFLKGETLAASLARRPGGVMSEAEVMAWLTPLLEGLQTIHAAGFLHRDLKPENIFLETNGPPVLIDFGAARNILTNRNRSLTSVLPLGYAPLEQYGSNAANQGPWTDMYSLGAVIYHCLTGAAPADSTERQDCVMNGAFDPLIAVWPNLTAQAGPALAAALEGSLRLARKERIQGIAEFRQLLVGGEPAKPKPEAKPAEILRPATAKTPETEIPVSRPWLKIDAVAAALAVILAVVIAFNKGREAEEPNLDELSIQADALFHRQNYDEAFPLYQKAADQGHAGAQFNLGLMYDDGQGVPQNYAQAVHWFQKAADQGHAGAQLKLGFMYDEGQGVPQNYAQAVHWYQKAADQDNADAQLNLGIMYGEGQGVPQNDAQAVHWYQKAADQSNAIAQRNLGIMYALGRGAPKNMAKARQWLKKAAANDDQIAKKLLKEQGW